jgi:hypothetical protein
MRKKEHILRASAEQIQAMHRGGEVQSDWKGAEQLTHAEVERPADEEKGPFPRRPSTSVSARRCRVG